MILRTSLDPAHRLLQFLRFVPLNRLSAPGRSRRPYAHGFVAAFYKVRSASSPMAVRTGPVSMSTGMANRPSPNASSRHRVLIAGGGVAALEAMLALHELAGRSSMSAHRAGAALLVSTARRCRALWPRGVHRLELAQLCEQAGAEFSWALSTSITRAGACEHTTVSLRMTRCSSQIGAVGTEAIPAPVSWPRGLARLPTPADRARPGRRALVFALPGGQSWPLPLYELALLTAAFVNARQIWA